MKRQKDFNIETNDSLDFSLAKDSDVDDELVRVGGGKYIDPYGRQSGLNDVDLLDD